jgi:hypothetical protein
VHDGNELTAYANAQAAGDVLPDGPPFFAPGWYMNVQLEPIYMDFVKRDVQADPRADRAAARGGSATLNDCASAVDDEDHFPLGDCSCLPCGSFGSVAPAGSGVSFGLARAVRARLSRPIDATG